MRQTIEYFAVDGIPFLLPDGPVKTTCQDVLSPESGQDESGCMHRFVLGHNRRTWEFTYRNLTQKEKIYIDSLFARKERFTFTHPEDDQGRSKSQCYCHDVTMVWRTAEADPWGDYTFRITQL